MGRNERLYALQDAITMLGRHREIRSHAVAAMAVGPGAQVVEIGCGTGRNFPWIQDRIGPEGRLIGVDLSADMLGAAERLVRARGWRNVELVQGDGAAVDLGEGAFDGVVSVLAMSVVPDHRAVLARCRSLLRSGGVLSVCDARLFTGRMAVINPLVRVLYEGSTGWRPRRDLPDDMRREFGTVVTRSFNFGTFFVAWSRKQATASVAGGPE